MSVPDYSLVVQGSEEWKQLRCGIVTTSRMADVTATTKKGEGADRKKYRDEILCEILTGAPYPQSADRARQVQWGKEWEDTARAEYELKFDVLVDTCGFVMHPTIPRFGGSPDGFVGDDGMIQIKCPNTNTHVNWMLGGTIPLEHAHQMAAEMSVYGKKWCDFVSFDPRLPEHLKLFVRRWNRNDQIISQLDREVIRFNAEVDQMLAALPQKPQGIVIAMDSPNRDEVQF
jgi:hypothetical protein